MFAEADVFNGKKEFGLGKLRYGYICRITLPNVFTICGDYSICVTCLRNDKISWEIIKTNLCKS